MTNALELTSLTKRYGSSRGVEDLHLTVKSGEVVGFLGPNGAGKTTTINMLMGFTSPSSGTATIFGFDVTTEGTTARKHVGYLSNDLALDENLTGGKELDYLGSLQGSYDVDYVNNLAERLDAELDKKISQLSRGNKQKIGLLSALMHAPDLLILDEPTSGLDPLIQSAFNEIILEHRKQGRTAFISSHVLSEVEQLCDRFVFLREGKIIADKTATELQEHAGHNITVVTKDAVQLQKRIASVDGVSELRKHNGIVRFVFNGAMNEMLGALQGITVDDLEITETDLEQIFMSYYENEKRYE
jgi:ABC-2 type transport system ATP-binding protein